jgi:hypothetical protein
MNHDVIWTQPPPLWASPALKYSPNHSGIPRRPEMFRFTADSFMEDFLNVLATEPERLKEFKVRPETWRGFSPQPVVQKRKPPSAVLRHLRLFRPPKRNGFDFPGAQAQEAPAQGTNRPLKLYQPAHQRHYLVASSLVCRSPGLPDRAVNPSNEERAGFVMRRLLPPADNPTSDPSNWEEHAWILGARGNAWKKVSRDSPKTLADGEEVLPMFGVHFDEPDRRRR